MASKNQAQLRDARDRLIDFLNFGVHEPAYPTPEGQDNRQNPLTDKPDVTNLGVPLPLRDLPVRPLNPKVASGTHGWVLVELSQPGVTYKLYRLDDAGNETPVPGSTPVPGTGAQIRLLTNPMDGDTEYTVWAEKTIGSLVVKEKLLQYAFIEEGIDTRLEAAWRNPVQLDYNSTATLQILKSQEEVSYVLYNQAGTEALSGEVPGTGETIELTTRQLPEDETITVKCTKVFYEDRDTVTNENDEAPQPVRTEVEWLQVQGSQPDQWVKREMPLAIRPNPALAVSIVNKPIAYNAKVNVAIKGTQASTEYYLYRFSFDEAFITFTDTAPTAAQGPHFSRKTENPERPIAYVKPNPITINMDAPAPYTYVGMKKGNNGNINIPAASLTDDSLFIVVAKKVENKLAVQLPAMGAVLVRPNPDVAVTQQAAAIAANTTGVLELRSTQLGVQYQLLQASDGAKIGPVAYHHKNKGIDLARIMVDFVIGEYPGELLLLETQPINANTAYTIQAIKAYTGVTAPVTGSYTFTIANA